MLPLLLIFILVIVLIRFKIPVGVTLLAAALFLGVYSYGISGRLWKLILDALVDSSTWKLMLSVGLILTFADIFESAGFVKLLVSALESFLSPGWVARVAPAIIGLLPMPGGAMVSAPIVKQIGRDTDVTPEQFTASNYWWRHVWETTWPLYPSIILAATVLGVSVWDVAIINFPISLTCIASGFLLRKVGSSMKASRKMQWGSLLRSLWPILFIVMLGLILKVDIVISVAFVILIVILTSRLRLKTLLKGLAGGFSPDIVALIFGVMCLMFAIEKTGVATGFCNDLLAMSIPTSIVVFAVPFMMGLLTGVTSAYIGVGFPIVLPLIGTPLLSLSSGMLLAFAGGFMGVMASPVHLCLVLTKDYFKASLPRTLVLIAVPILLTSIVSWVLATTLYR